MATSGSNSDTGDASGGNSDAESHDEYQLFSFFIYSMVIYPVVQYILTSAKTKKFSPLLRIAAAIAFLALVFYWQLEMEKSEEGPNYYQVFGLPRTATTAHIKRAFRQLSLEMHPDKNRQNDTTAAFTRMKHAHDVLTDPGLREAYDYLGDRGVHQAVHGVLDFSSVLTSTLLRYVSTLLLVFVMTFSDSSGATMQACFVVVAAMFVFEYKLIILGESSWLLPGWLFPAHTPYNLITIMHRAFPVFMSGCRSIHSAFHVDNRKLRCDCLMELSKLHREVVEDMNHYSFKVVSHIQQLQQQPSSTPTPPTEGTDATETTTNSTRNSNSNSNVENERSINSSPMTYGMRLARFGVDKAAVAQVQRIAQHVESNPYQQQLELQRREKWSFVRNLCGYLIVMAIVHFTFNKR